jgi:recombinational DNA repair protein RecR
MSTPQKTVQVLRAGAPAINYAKKTARLTVEEEILQGFETSRLERVKSQVRPCKTCLNLLAENSTHVFCHECNDRGINDTVAINLRRIHENGGRIEVPA